MKHFARLVKQIKERYPIEVCVSAGFLDASMAQTLKEAGLDRYNHNLNTSAGHYGRICTTHDYRDRLATLEAARGAGLEVCSGVIVGMGEPPEDVVQVARELRRLGLGRLPVVDGPRRIVRYERDRPGELVHLDIKKLGRISLVGHRIHGDRRRRTHGRGWEFVHVAIDDHTRIAYVEVLPDETAPTAAAFLARAVAWYAALGITVERILTDNGSCYRALPFGEQALALGIGQRFTRPYRPQTNGKAERFIRTLINEWAYNRAYARSGWRTRALAHYLSFYNTERPHSALGNLTPAARLASYLSTTC